MSDTSYLTANEAAAVTGRSSDLVRRFANEGRIPGAVRTGWHWLVPVSSLDAIRAQPRKARKRPTLAA